MNVVVAIIIILRTSLAETPNGSAEHGDGEAPEMTPEAAAGGSSGGRPRAARAGERGQEAALRPRSAESFRVRAQTT